MRVLVTGAGGAIGGALCNALLAHGDQPVGLSRNPERARAAQPRVEWHAWTPTLERPPRASLEGTEAVVNLVGESLNQRWTAAAKKRIWSSRVTATKNLVGGILTASPGPRVLVSQSAVGYYGDRGDQVIDESAGPGESWDARLCVAWEEAALEAEAGDVRVVRARTGPVIGRDMGLLEGLLPPFRLGVGGPLAGGRNYVPWVSLTDEVAIILWALERPEARGAYNACAPNPITNATLTRALGKALRRPAVLPIPKLVLRARLGSELAEAVTGSQRLLPRRLLDEGYEFRVPDLGDALRLALR